jgi:hypothetical protein
VPDAGNRLLSCSLNPGLGLAGAGVGDGVAHSAALERPGYVHPHQGNWDGEATAPGCGEIVYQGSIVVQFICVSNTSYSHTHSARSVGDHFLLRHSTAR